MKKGKPSSRMSQTTGEVHQVKRQVNRNWNNPAICSSGDKKKHKEEKKRKATHLKWSGRSMSYCRDIQGNHRKKFMKQQGCRGRCQWKPWNSHNVTDFVTWTRNVEREEEWRKKQSVVSKSQPSQCRKAVWKENKLSRAWKRETIQGPETVKTKSVDRRHRAVKVAKKEGDQPWRAQAQAPTHRSEKSRFTPRVAPDVEEAPHIMKNLRGCKWKKQESVKTEGFRYGTWHFLPPVIFLSLRPHFFFRS